jgi:hypothetical protein
MFNIINLRLSSVLVAVTGVLLLTRISAAQVIGLAPPFSGTSESRSSSASDSTLGFSNISANDVNTDRYQEMLEHVRETSAPSDSSGVETSIAAELSQFNGAWWPRYNTSAEEAAVSLTAKFAQQVGMPDTRRVLDELPAGLVRLQSWQSGIEIPELALAGSELTGAADSSEFTSGNGAVEGYSQGAFGDRSFLDQRPLSAPEPGSIALIVALCFVSATFKVVRRKFR